ncbi:hypothetical protein [Sphingomonas crocodyli]|uniref:Sel1 repeat family protein n=1 Tax=Sphingomonas crocodyli TaxID=1979270 RepID=A0A437LXR2_9SPHN|nr:hypothetical protein [Sphingomonas crocodyli]RVT90201.1 hypothetical protein EOD43_18045 [Sphingomonas crocodyli]
MGHSISTQQFLADSRLRDAVSGNTDACFDLGICYSAGTDGYGLDLIEAHKWFNIAAVKGDRRAGECRAEVSQNMTAREIAEAQRQARALLTSRQSPTAW